MKHIRKGTVSGRPSTRPDARFAIHFSIANRRNETHQKRDGQRETNMSSDNTPHPSVKHCADTVNARYIHGRPESELVPSRYALKVGAIDVMVVSDGVLSLPGAMLGAREYDRLQ